MVKRALVTLTCFLAIAGCTEAPFDSASRYLNRSAGDEISAWKSGNRPSCDVPIYDYDMARDPAVSQHFPNCLNLVYLISDDLPSEVLALTGVEGLRVPGTASDITGIETFAGLRYLSIYTRGDARTRRGYHPIDFTPLASLHRLEVLDINVRDFSGPRALDPVGTLRQLESLALNEWVYPDISAIGKLTELTRLRIGGRNVSSIDALAKLHKLRVLDLRFIRALSDISALSSMRDLTSLNLATTSVRDLSAMRGLVKLKYLNLSETHIVEISALSALHQLVSVDLSRTSVRDISALNGHRSLTDLNLEGTEVTNLGPLATAVSLETLSLGGEGPIDLAPLLRLPKLKEVYVDPDRVQPAQLQALLARGVTVDLPEMIVD